MPANLDQAKGGGVGTRGRPRQRVVLLGASNLTRGISTVVRLAQLTFDGPLEVVAALGAGRSYGVTSRVLVRELPGIDGCALWDALASRSRLPTSALLTDIGNDIFYGATVEQIVGWVERSLDRLAKHNATIVMTLLPADNAEQISAWRFRLLRRMMFRNCTLELGEVQATIQEINERLRAVARQRSIQLVAQRADWYGFDPIHIRFDRWPRAWSEILSTWRRDSEKNFSPAPSLSRWLYLRSLPPHERTIFGRLQRAHQPAGRLADGTTISFY
ncbi:MAG: hypothetical protein WD894_10880 [Pirellulales bacterium]